MELKTIHSIHTEQSGAIFLRQHSDILFLLNIKNFKTAEDEIWTRIWASRVEQCLRQKLVPV